MDAQKYDYAEEKAVLISLRSGCQQAFQLIYKKYSGVSLVLRGLSPLGNSELTAYASAAMLFEGLSSFQNKLK